MGAVSYFCVVGLENAFNVSLTIPPHLSCWAIHKTNAENQRITLSRVKKGLLLFDEKPLRDLAWGKKNADAKGINVVRVVGALSRLFDNHRGVIGTCEVVFSGSLCWVCGIIVIFAGWKEDS